MNVLIKSVGVVFVLLGILYIIKPNIMKKMLGFFSDGLRLYVAGGVRIVMAVIFISGARECRNYPVIFTLGILFLLGGLAIFTLGPKKLKPMILWLHDRKKLTMRILSVMIILVGGLVIYCA